MALDRKACADAVAACACFNFRRVSRSVTQAFDAALQPSGLRSTQFVLLALIGAEEPVSLPRLSQALVADRSTLTRALKPLERDGLVRTESQAGSRGLAARLTPLGRRKVEETVPLWQDVQGRFVRRLGVRRWRDLLGSLSEVVPKT